MASPEELGIDARTAEIVRSLPQEQQDYALESLRQQMEQGMVRNPSAHILTILNDPEILGLDDRALQTLKELPEASRRVIIAKFRSTKDVRNPSAWVANAVINLKKETGTTINARAPPMVVGYGQQMCMGHQPVIVRGMVPQTGAGFGFNSLDARAQGLLRSLPRTTQQEILGKLMLQPHVNNPSAWVAKAALSAGATADGSKSAPADAGVGAWEPYDDFDPTVAAYLSSYQLDSGARTLLQTLPLDAQMEIAGKLVSQSDIKNPSGWVVKAAIQAGAKGQSPPGGAPAAPRSSSIGMGMGMGGGSFVAAPPPSFAAVAPASMMPGYATAPSTFGGGASYGAVPQAQQLDNGARELLQTLAPHVQQDLLNKMATAAPKNPSGWMVKAATSAGARRPSPVSSNMGSVGGAAAALPPGCQVDEKAQQLLQSLQPHQQRDIIIKLSNSWNEGKVQNPSAWVAKAAMKAGAPGMNPQAQAAAAIRYAPY